MTEVEVIQKELKSLLQTSVPRPSSTICNSIANLKDLYETTGSLDWRRGTSAHQQTHQDGYKFHPSSSSDSLNKRFHFRANGAPDTPISRVSSTKSIQSTPTATSPTSPPPPIAKYQSKFKNSAQPVDERILYNIILSKLNKFSLKTYDEIRDFLYQILGSGEADLQEMVRDFMRLVFQKAAVEETFCPLYAKLLCELSGRYSVILQEMFTLQSNYLAIFDDVPGEEITTTDYDAFVEGQKHKQYRRGYSQFLAELTTLEILDLNLLDITFQRILKNILACREDESKRTLNEEYSDCLMRMARVLRKRQTLFFVRARQTLWKSNETTIHTLLETAGESKGISAKTKFMMMDIKDILTGAQ
jgi:hypothetical protein